MNRDNRPFAVTVNYQTPNGNAGSWRGTVVAKNERSAIDTAQKWVRQTRSVLKIDGGDCQPV